MFKIRAPKITVDSAGLKSLSDIYLESLSGFSFKAAEISEAIMEARSKKVVNLVALALMLKGYKFTGKAQMELFVTEKVKIYTETMMGNTRQLFKVDGIPFLSIIDDRADMVHDSYTHEYTSKISFKFL